LAESRRPGDIAVISLHWGGNWGYGIPLEHRRLAHAIVDEADVSIVHGHSSHHAKAIEVYRGRLILYGCGDFLNDYEGISGREEFRGDLALMYFASVDAASGDLFQLDMTRLQIRHFQLTRAAPEDVIWLKETLNRTSREFATRIEAKSDGRLAAAWR
jgi:poly-gamma-glutamate capsule biosynthesis protein CapA/YwtB (metallophosphatase superfamily)